MRRRCGRRCTGFSRNLLLVYAGDRDPTAALVYLALALPVRAADAAADGQPCRLSRGSRESARIIVPSATRDEIGVAERELFRHCSATWLSMLHQKSGSHAALGLPVSKINHDLRNLWRPRTAVDQLASVPDPRVQPPRRS